MDKGSGRFGNDATAHQGTAVQRTSPLVLWAACSLATILGFSRLSYGLLLPALRADLGGSYGVYGTHGTVNFVGSLYGSVSDI